MLLAGGLVFVVFLTDLFSLVDARKCTQSYTCPTTCTRRHRYHTKCGFLNWKRCTRYRTEKYSCDGSCTRQVCCHGYTGSDCLTPTCYGHTSCLHGNLCKGVDSCSCTVGYALPKCEDINECSSSNGGCQHVCSNSVGSFQCSCHHGYTLSSDLKTCDDNNECLTSNGGCTHDCTNTDGSYTCSCRDGYTLSSDGHTCEDTDECTLGTALCNQGCHNTDGSYTCSCSTGYSQADEHTCVDIDECSATPSPCTQTCQNTPGSFSCGCLDGYYVDPTTNSCTDTNECLTNNGKCSQTCTNTDGSFQCSCQPGYQLQPDASSCQDVDECSEGTARCSHTCTNTPGSYSCSCNHGYQLDADGVTCSDIDDCQGSPCKNGGVCIDNIASFTCSCAKGFTGTLCEEDVDECVGFLNGGCEDICTNTFGAFYCGCQGNVTLNPDGRTCQSASNLPDVFKRHSIVRRFLPRGCSTIQLARCENGHTVEMVMSSTAPWYKLRSDPSRIYTYGIVFIELNALAIPISITGLEVVRTDDDFKLVTGSLALNTADGDAYGQSRVDGCLTFDITPRDIQDFLESNSFLRTLFHQLEDWLPDWLQFSTSGDVILDVNDLATDVQTGAEIQKGECQGAPVFSDHMYTVLKFGNSFALSLYGQEVVLPEVMEHRKFCVIIDICQDYGGTMFLLLPDGSRDVLDKFDIFKSLIDQHGLYIRPVGIGVSVLRQLNVHADTSHLQLWNGDQMFQYPVFPEANFWVGGEVAMETDLVTASGTGNMFLSVPSPKSLLKNLFLDEWGMMLRFRSSAALEFKFDSPFGEQTIRSNIYGEANALASLGGTQQRSWCGNGANPPGIFFSLAVSADAFLDAPILKFLKPDVNVKVHAFVTNDMASHTPDTIDLLTAITDAVDLKGTVDRLVDTTHLAVGQYKQVLSNRSVEAMNDVVTAGHHFDAHVDFLVDGISNYPSVGLDDILNRASVVWDEGFVKVNNITETFIDSVRDNNVVLQHNLTETVKAEIAAIRNRVHAVLKRLTINIMSSVKQIDGFGLRLHGDLNIFGIKLLGLDLEIVYSVDRLGSCSRFQKVYDLLKGQKAIRIYVMASTNLIKLHPLLKHARPDTGAGIGVAISLQETNVILMMHVEVTLLGIKGQVDMFISNKGVYYYLEGNVWDIYKAQLESSFEVGTNWYEITQSVKGRFVADADGDGNFNDGYLAALRRATQHLADDAAERIGKVQDKLTVAQGAMTTAQDWLDKRKADIYSANSKFDDAVRAMDRAKDKLEEAKRPFQNAVDALDRAQRKVDRLCRIRSCRTICIPGIKCRICHKKVWGLRIPYPCCRFTKCMISFKDPLCLIANGLCYVVRGIAYLALEAAKIFVRIPMLALDVAKVAVSAAQFVVDKSRVVLDIAAAALDVAMLGLEGAKLVLDGAKLALEVVKQVVKYGVKALNFIIQFGLESIIDVRNCGFEVQVSTHDKNVFGVHCEINLFKLGYREIGFRINFNDIFQSLWYAAKATIKAVLDTVADIITGRRRREIEDKSVLAVYKYLRETRDAGFDDMDTLVNETINVVSDTVGFRNSSDGGDYDARAEIFEEKCQTFKLVHGFLQDAIQLLFDMSDETANVVNNVTSAHTSSKDIEQTVMAFTFTDIGIDVAVAQSEFNISTAELNSTIENAKSNLTDDALYNDVTSYADEADGIVQEQMTYTENVDILTHWIAAMDNSTRQYFDETDCLTFLDCALYSVQRLYEMNIMANDPNSTDTGSGITQVISDFEDVFLNLTGNTSHSIQFVYSTSMDLNSTLNDVRDMNVFCATPPTMTSSLDNNQTLVTGDVLRLDCDVTGDPQPGVWWFKDNEHIADGVTFIVDPVSINDTGTYHCVAGNIVANLTSGDVHVTVLSKEPKTANETSTSSATATMTSPAASSTSTATQSTSTTTTVPTTPAGPCPARACAPFEYIGVAPGCTQFCQCDPARNGFVLLSCLSDLVFNTDVRACSWPDQVDVATCTTS